MAKHFIKQFRFACVSFCTYYVVCILLGAPLFEQWKETGLMSLILTICTNLPFLMTFEGNLDNLRSVLAPSLPEEKFVAFIDYGCVIGAWLSAGFLVLDWDRPWQAWPIPCVVGAILGTFVGWILFKIYSYFSHVSQHRISNISSCMPSFSTATADNKYRYD
ncbi:Phosphatidylinositol-glycan biosynthesis class F protein [Schistosoma japonicum]|uniref:Phosphatidylinositol-glycan biosynthesis class F protein n=1 Tax=Schistosoma japonicum TaxID=6182 RepID=A0A4Z2DR22_SCHJA|nr:Phosphatidylinositol-glycan biosynthesis class F protein [Schistosoma japonicum]